MAKLLKILGRSFGAIIEWLLILVILFAFLIRTSPVQTFLANETADYLSSELKAEVKVDRVSIVFVDRAAIDGLLIRDQQGDTLIYAKRIYLKVGDYSIKKKHYTIQSATIENAFIHIQRSKDNVFNHAFLRDYFVRDKKKKNKIKFDLKNASLHDSRFRYDDQRKDPIDAGMDYFHLSASNINGDVTGISIRKDVITGDISRLELEEKCGFKLRHFTSKAEVSPRGVLLSDLDLSSNDSRIKSSKFNLLSDSYNCFKYFVDSVTFDAVIDESDVSLKDVSYFASVFDGMDDKVRLTTTVDKKVTNLRLKNFDLQYKEHTRVKGTINMDDYRRFQQGFFQENLDYLYVDIDELKALKLPDASPSKYISISPEIERLQYIEAEDIHLTGLYSNFVFGAHSIKTAIGSIQLDNGIQFTQNPERESYTFEKSEASNYDVKINHFELGTYLANDDIGSIEGKLFLTGEIFSASDIIFHDIKGELNHLEYMDYPYSNITLEKASFQNNIFEGVIFVNDPNLNAEYRGTINTNRKQHMDFNVLLRKAVLHNLNLSDRESELSANITIDLHGMNLNTFEGSVDLGNLHYVSKGKSIPIDTLHLTAQRMEYNDVFEITSDAGYAKILGNINFDHLLNDVNYQFSRILPALYKNKVDKNNLHRKDDFKYEIRLADANKFLDIFYPELKVAKETRIEGAYKGNISAFELNGLTEYINYNNIVLNDIQLKQNLDSNSIYTLFNANNLIYNDSLHFHDVEFKTTGGNNLLNHLLAWDTGTAVASEIDWETKVHDADHLQFLLNPSYFFINEKKWNIEHQSTVRMDRDTIKVENFELTRNNQNIFADGQISNQDRDKLKFRVQELDLSEISTLITTEITMSGIINSTGFISNPFNRLGFQGEGFLSEFIVNNRNVGDISVTSNWDPKKRSIHSEGNLYYKDEKTFGFKGEYFLDQMDENLDFDLDFDYTDIQFTNAFMDPDVLSEIRGMLKGKIDLTGTPEQPRLEGIVNLYAGSAYVDILGVHFGIDGPIEVEPDGFLMNGIPVFDQDGNSGMLIGAVFHENYDNFNFNLQFDLEPAGPVLASTLFGPQEYNRFLVMELPYSHDGLYYGKGYVTGSANLFGYTDNLEITVDFKTVKGTTVNIPMYGVGEIEEEGFIDFVNKAKKDSVTITTEPKFDFTGVDLDLNFSVTKDADIFIIFNEEIGDIIHARGTGDIAISLDNIGDVKMEGIFTVDNGEYDFAMTAVKGMGAVKQKFTIDQGGTISWAGDPYDADLNLRTHYKINANLADISNDQLVSKTSSHQTVLSYLNLSGSMLEPEIAFDLEAPQADDIGRTLINRIKSDPDELNRQFFSLMMIRKFQPLAQFTGGNGSAALDLVTNQINSMLAAVTKDYVMNVGFDSDQLSGDNIYEFGVSKGFLNDRLIFSGSFGVESYGENHDAAEGNGSSQDAAKGQLIGDINLEYLLNESGTFRVNIFNESTDKTIITEEDLGDFTQGAGLLYKEDFNSFEDFKLVQYVFDIFRKKENKRYKNKRKRQQRPVPQDNEGIVGTESTPVEPTQD